MKSSIAVALVLAAAHLTAGATPNAAMEKFLARADAVHSYHALRHLEAAGYGQRGWLDAQTTYAPAAGLHYDVVAEGGSGIIRSRVLRPLLEEEQQLIARGATAEVALTQANYRFTPDGVSDDGLTLVGLDPLRKERALIVGRLLLTPDDGHLVRVEGQLAKSPSFWLPRVLVTRSYERVNGVVFPVTLESNAQMRLFGRSTLRMTYAYSEVDGRPVTHP